jgi:hypothetical protein
MHTTGMSFKANERQMGYHYTVVGRLVEKTHTNQQCERLATMPNVFVDVCLPTVDV